MPTKKRPRIVGGVMPDTGVPPLDAIAYFKAKGLKPGFSYLDVWREEHVAAFTVAKVMERDILAGVQASVDKALREGMTLEEWKEEVRPLLERSGWAAHGDNVPYRLKRIYDTNMRVARACGQWQRIQRTKASQPFLIYQLGPSEHHRPEHVAWNGLILPVDDPFWQTHMPPNGWGCRCRVTQLTRAAATRLGGPGVAPPLELVTWENPLTGENIYTPKGIDPGWDYNPGMHRLKNIGGKTPKSLAPKPEPKPEPKPVAAPTRKLMPKDKRIAGLPDAYYEHETAPNGEGFSAESTAVALARLEKGDASAGAIVRKQLNEILAARGMVSHDIINAISQKASRETRIKLKEERDALQRKVEELARRLAGSSFYDADYKQIEAELESAKKRRDESDRQLLALTLDSMAGSKAEALRLDPTLIRKEEAAGFHGWLDGEIVIDSSVEKDAFEALVSKAAGIPVSELGSGAFGTFVHEAIHGHSPMIRGSAYKGLGAKLEEGTTELASQQITQEVLGARPYYRSYEELCEALEKAAADLRYKEPEKVATDAAIAMRRRVDRVDSAYAFLETYALELPRTRKEAARAEKAAAKIVDGQIARARDAAPGETVRGGGGWNLTEELRGPNGEERIAWIRREYIEMARHTALRKVVEVIEKRLRAAKAYTKNMEHNAAGRATLEELEALIDSLEVGDVDGYTRAAAMALELGVFDELGPRLLQGVALSRESVDRYTANLEGLRGPRG